jgi:hypothetical protein
MGGPRRRRTGGSGSVEHAALPPSRRVVHPLRTLETAVTSCTVLDVGARGPALTTVNRHLRRSVLPDDMARAWLRHNVEQVGHLEHVLPAAIRR